MRRDRALQFLWCVVIVLLLLSANGCGLARPVEPAIETSSPALKDDMRMPWEPSSPTYLRDFLVCGPFIESALPPGSQPATSSAVSKQAAIVDYLTSAGGEANVRPHEGQIVTAKDGAKLTWKAFSSSADMIDMRVNDPFAQNKMYVVYAYTTVHRDSPAKVALSFNNKAPLIVYVNGEKVMSTYDRSASLKSTISLKEGDNAVLIRINGAGDRLTFTIGFNDKLDTPTDSALFLRASIVSPRDDAAKLSIKVSNENRLAPPTVTVEVLAPAGKLVDRAEVPLDQTHTFDIADWADGPYEIRALSRTPDGVTLTRYQTWYKGDWKQEVANVSKEARRLPEDSNDPIILKKRLLREILLAQTGIKETPSDEITFPAEAVDLNKIASALLEYREAEILEKSPASTNGFHRLAWRDEVDGSPQFARLYLPLNYDPAKKYPMVVSLHGHNSRNPAYAANDTTATRHNYMAERFDIIRLEPHGRGNTGYRGIGEADVMRAVSLARQKFSVDDQRIYLRGTSMGGGGVWYLGSRHTDVFAALAPNCGGGDYRIWVNPEDFATWPPQQVMLEESYGSFAQAESLRDTPVFVNHGDSDITVNVENSRYAVRMLQRWGYDIRYWEHPGKGHTGWGVDDATLINWFLRYRLNQNPRHVLLRAPRLDGADAHWVHAEQQEDPFAFMLVDATVNSDDTVIIWSKNVLQLRLNPGKDLLDTGKPFRLVWNGQDVQNPQLTSDGQIVLRAKGYEPGKLAKKSMGPTPFAIVVGTISKDERMRRFCQFLAERERDDWKEWQHVTPRYFKDTEIADDQIRKFSLVLYGGPEDNAVTARLIKDIPLTIEQNRIAIDGRAFDVTDAAVRIVYPHPLNADRNVTIVAANSADAMYWGNILDDRADFVIDDGRVSPEKDYYRNIAAWGRFDCHWRLNDKYLTSGEPAVRAQAGRRKAPTRLSLATAEPAVMLSEAMESQAKGVFRKAVRDLNWQGNPIRLNGKTYAKGIAVSRDDEKCLVDYDLSGGNWQRLKATIGIEIDQKLLNKRPKKDNPKIIFLVRGDGKELYKSPSFDIDSKPLNIDVDVSGVKTLELEVTGQWLNFVSSVDWADIRLEK